MTKPNLNETAKMPDVSLQDYPIEKWYKHIIET